MSQLSYEPLIFLLAACHVISVAYLFFADYVRIRYRTLRNDASKTAIVVVMPWLIYAAFFVAFKINCPGAQSLFSAPIQCALDLIWLFYVGLGVFLISFAWGSALCWHLYREIRRDNHPRPAH